MSASKGNRTNLVLNNNQPLHFNNDQLPSSSSSSVLPSDNIQNRDDRKERQDFPSSTKPGYPSDAFVGLPSAPGCMMGNAPPYPNMPSMCFPQGPMKMMMGGPMGFNPFWNMNPMGMMPGPRPTSTMKKEILTFKSSVLYPPPPGSKLPSTKEHPPPGCRTIFVGGVPENVTEEHLKEIFEHSGEICSIRVSKKNFAHIRFTFHASVERALYISGYYMKIDNKDDKPNCGRLHVDYGTARDDQYEYECQQRQWARQLRHRQKLEEERLRPPSPPQIVVYTENEANLLQEKLKNDETVPIATKILITWMERGYCNRKTVNTFYSLLQTINSNVRRLLSEKETHEEEIRKLQENFRQRFTNILSHFEQIEKVFTTACKQKSWDHFSKPQRKNIDLWSKQIQEIQIAQQEEFFNEYQDDAMEMSDGEDGEPGTPAEPPTKKTKSEIDQNLQDENDVLKCQVEAYKNEINIAKQESLNSLEMKDKQIKAFQLALQGMQQQLISSRQLSNSSEKPSSSKNDTLTDSTCEENSSKCKEPTPDQENRSFDSEDQSASSSNINDSSPCLSLSTSQAINSNDLVISKQQIKLIGLLSCFLNVHPMGASPDYIWSYVKQMQIQIRASEIEELLERLPSLFKLEVFGCGASLERRWKFTGFDN